MSRVILGNVCCFCWKLRGSALSNVRHTARDTSRTPEFKKLLIQSQSYATSNQESTLNVFDRKAKRQQKNRTAFMDNYNVYEYVKEEVSQTPVNACHDSNDLNITIILLYTILL